MSIEEENKALILRFCELDNRRDLEAIFTLIAPGYVAHYSTSSSSREQSKQSWPMIWTAFPDMHVEIEHMVAEGDKVAFREICTGTHKGQFMGVMPTGKKVRWINTCIIKIADGIVVESWTTNDEYNLMQQLGAIPSQ